MTTKITKPLTKLDIESFDFKLLDSLTESEFLLWTQQHQLTNHREWFLPQLVAQFGRWDFCVRQGKVDVKQTLANNELKTDPKQRVLWKFSRLQRSELVPSQVKFPEYSKLVPLIILAARDYHKIPYSAWQGVDNLNLILEPDLLEALDIEGIDDLYGLGSERLLQIREYGLMTKSGNSKGSSKNPLTTWALTGVQDTELGGLPKLTQTILCQIWCAHPQQRHKNMILDLRNWDVMPEPLLSTEILQEPKTKAKPKVAKPSAFDLADLPWN